MVLGLFFSFFRMSLYLVQILYCQLGHKPNTVKVLGLFFNSSVGLVPFTSPYGFIDN